MIKCPVFLTRIYQALWIATEEARDTLELVALALGSEDAGTPVIVNDIMKSLLKPRLWGKTTELEILEDQTIVTVIGLSIEQMSKAQGTNYVK